MGNKFLQLIKKKWSLCFFSNQDDKQSLPYVLQIGFSLFVKSLICSCILRVDCGQYFCSSNDKNKLLNVVINLISGMWISGEVG
jgi:hypothetical protein